MPKLQAKRTLQSSVIIVYLCHREDLRVAEAVVVVALHTGWSAAVEGSCVMLMLV